MTSRAILKTLDKMLQAPTWNKFRTKNGLVHNCNPKGLREDHPFWKLTEEERLEVYEQVLFHYTLRG